MSDENTNQDQAATPDPTPVDEVDQRLAELRAQKAARDAAANDPRLEEIRRLEAELAAPSAPEPAPALQAGQAWAAVPTIAETPPEKLDPMVAEILRQLNDANQQLAQMRAQQAAQAAYASGVTPPPPDARLVLACGDTVRVASAIPTHHYCEGHGETVKVLFGHLLSADPEPLRGV